MRGDRFVNSCVETTRRIARKAFHDRPDREELVLDAMHLAWEDARNAPPAATPKTVAKFAIKGIKSGRPFSRSKRSLTAREHRARRRDSIRVANACRVGDNPADIVQAMLDVAAWLASLPPWKRRVAQLLAAGHTTREVAQMVNRSPARISQLRREFMKSYREFTGEG